MSNVSVKERKKPGRKAETPAERMARLEQDLALARKAVHDGKQRALVAIANAVLDEAADDTALSERVRQIVSKRVTKKADRTDVLALIGAA